MMYVCIHNDKVIDHANELDGSDLEAQWPLYELECVNRGFAWVAYKGETPYTFPVEVPDET